jgi:hypothetical protein
MSKKFVVCGTDDPASIQYLRDTVIPEFSVALHDAKVFPTLLAAHTALLGVAEHYKDKGFHTPPPDDLYFDFKANGPVFELTVRTVEISQPRVLVHIVKGERDECNS